MIIFSFLFSLPLHGAMIPSLKQIALINSFFRAPQQQITIIKKAIDEIEQKNLHYADYAERKGIIWKLFYLTIKYIAMQ
jgi:hypothetical protein